MKSYKGIFFLILLLAVLLGGAGYSFYWYKNNTYNKNVLKTADDISNLYMDTLILEVKSALSDINTKVDLLTKEGEKNNISMIFSYVMIMFNLLLTIIICFLVASIRRLLKKQ